MERIEKVTKQKQSDLHQRSNGKSGDLPYRASATYVCHRYSNGDHNEIAKYFGLTHRGSISVSLTRIRQEITDKQWGREVKSLEIRLFIVKNQGGCSSLAKCRR